MNANQNNQKNKNHPPVRRFKRHLISQELAERIRNIFPAFLLAMILSLAVPMVKQPVMEIPEEIHPDSPGENAPKTDLNFNASDLGALSESGDKISGAVAPIPDRVRLLSTAGERWERIRLSRESGRTESMIRAILNHDRVFQLSSTGMRMEELEFQSRRDSIRSGSRSNQIQFVLHDDAIYAFTEEEETEENRWVVIDNAVSGGNAPFNAKENAERVYSFAREALGVNTAAACGILANIQHESGFNPRAVFVEADGRISYGICQWNAGRLLALQNYCEQHGYDAASLGGQLQYLQYELTTRERAAFYRVRSVSDTGNGAYEAGYNWARYFERCADRYYTGRAETAYLTYWTKYGNANESFILSIIGETFPPDIMETGSAVDLRGIIRSDAKIIRVSAFIYDTNGTIIQSHEQSWNSGRYNLESDGVNQALNFHQLEPGDYIYTVRAADLSGAEKTLIESKFTVADGADSARIPLYAEVPRDSDSNSNSNPEFNPDLESNPEINPDANLDAQSGAPEDAAMMSANPDSGEFNGAATENGTENGVPADIADGISGAFNPDGVSAPDTGDSGREQTGNAIPEPPISDEEWAAISQEGYWEPVIPQNESGESDNISDADEPGADKSNHISDPTSNTPDTTDTANTPDMTNTGNTDQSGDMDGVTPEAVTDSAIPAVNPDKTDTDERIYTEPASPREPGAPSDPESPAPTENPDIPESPVISEEPASPIEPGARTAEEPGGLNENPDNNPDENDVEPESPPEEAETPPESQSAAEAETEAQLEFGLESESESKSEAAAESETETPDSAESSN